MQSSHQESCLEILNLLQSEKYFDKTRYFLTAVQDTIDDSEWQLYRTIIKSPRDLKSIHENLLANKYGSISAFAKDVNLCFDNAIKYNKQRYKSVYQAASALQKVFNAQMDKLVNNLPRGLTIPIPAPTPTPPPTSAPSPAAPPPSNAFDSAIATAILDSVCSLKAARWFDVAIDLTMPLYTKRIPSPIDLPTIRANIAKQKYATADQFALEMRRVFANSFVYNFDVSNPVRTDAKACLLKFEQEWRKRYERRVSPPLDELRECLDAIEEILQVIPVGAPQPAIVSFIDPVRVYYEGDTAWLKKYSQVVKSPMDYGSIIAKICEARYSDVEEILSDAKLVAQNCEKFFASSTKSTVELARQQDPLTMDAWMLYERFRHELTDRISSMAPPQSAESVTTSRQPSHEAEELLTEAVPPLKIKKRGISKGTPSQAVTQASAKKPSKAQVTEKVSLSEPVPAAAPVVAPIPSSKKTKVNISLKERYLWCLSELKAHHLKDGEVLGVQTCWPFLLAVDPIQYPSYYSVIASPMDMSSVERKVKGEKYPQLVNILKDFELIRDNAYTFNPGDIGKDIRYLADLTLCNFRFLLKQVALEILNCGDETFIQKHLPLETRDLILRSDDPLEHLSSEFYLPRFHATKNSSSPFASSDGGAPLEPEKPTLSRRKSVNKQGLLKFSVATASASSLDTQLSNEEVGYLLSQDNQSFAINGMGDDESGFDYDQDDPLYQTAGTVVRSASHKKANKGKRKKSSYPEELIVEPIPLVRLPSVGSSPMEQWEQGCNDLLKKLKRHEFLDLTKPNPKVFKADFFHPVIELFPDLATEYLQEIKNPMDFQIIFDRLLCHGFLDAQDVYDKIILIFQNTIDFNEPHIHENDHSSDAEFARKMVIRCKHMIRYVQWLANEMLLPIDDTNELHPESLGDIRLSLQQQYRDERMSILMNHPIDLNRECNNLLKKFENRKYAKDYVIFLHPVPIKDVHDYSVYVRHPMDFFTVKEKLEKHKYSSYGLFLKDLRLIFSNAMVYNKVHMETDPISKTCYQSAVLLSEKLEGWIHEEFSIDVAERILYTRIKMDEGAVVEAQKKEIKEKMDQELNEFRRQEIARMKSSDLMFAADQMRREFISGSLEPGTNMNILTPRINPGERPPMFYEPEVVEVALPGASSSLGGAHALDPSAGSVASGPSSAELIRENVWDYWRTHGPVYEKSVRPVSPGDAMELVRSDSESRLSRSDSRDSCDESPRSAPPLAAPSLASGPESLSSTAPPAPLGDLSDGTFSSFRMVPLRKKLRTPFGALSPAPVTTPRGKRSSALPPAAVAVVPFLEDENFLPNSDPNKVKAPSRVKRSREKDSPVGSSSSCQALSDPQPKKKRRGGNGEDEAEQRLEASNEPHALAPLSKPSLQSSHQLFKLRNLCSLFRTNAAVSSLRIPMSADNEETSAEPLIMIKYQTCNGICLLRILTPCSRQVDDLLLGNHPAVGDEAILSQPSPLEEQKSQSFLPDLGRETSLTLTADPSPATASANCVDLTGSGSTSSPAGAAAGGMNPLPKFQSTNASEPLPSGLLLKSLSSQAAMAAAKRKSDLDHIRKILSSTNRFSLEQKFKEDLVKKKLLGCFGSKRGGEELRKRALSLWRPVPDGVARVEYAGASIRVSYPIKPAIHIGLYPSKSMPLASAAAQSNNEVQLVFSSPPAHELLSQLFGRSVPSRSLPQLCALASHSSDPASDWFSAALQRDGVEFVACFQTQTNGGVKGSCPFRRWYQTSSETSCCCHISPQRKAPPAHLKIRRHDHSSYSLSGILPAASGSEEAEGSEVTAQLQYSWSPRIQMTLQQISADIFVSTTCQEVSFVRTQPADCPDGLWQQQRYLESWVMVTTEHCPTGFSPDASTPLFPCLDLTVK